MNRMKIKLVYHQKIKKIKSHKKLTFNLENAGFANKNKYSPGIITAKAAAIRKVYARCAEKESLTQEVINKQNVEFIKIVYFINKPFKHK